MAYVTVPKDLNAVKTKAMFNLTKRQLICFSLGGLFGGATYFAVQGLVSSTNAVSLMILAVFPFFMLAMYEKNGQTLEIILKQMYMVKFGTAKNRPYKSMNFYGMLENQYNLNREVNRIVKPTTKKPSNPANTRQKSIPKIEKGEKIDQSGEKTDSVDNRKA